MALHGKRILITGAARRLGREMALAVARAGGTVILHHGHSPQAAADTQAAIRALGGQAIVLQADLNDPAQTQALVAQAAPLDGLVNSAAIFAPLDLHQTTLDAWERHLRINLTAPFLLCQAFAAQIGDRPGRIVNILDWRALRPGADHLPYTISKAGLAALTRALAVALAPQVTVNGLALGALLPPADGGDVSGVLDAVPAGRWAQMEELAEALLFLLDGPAYITGEIIHLDGGRHLL